MIDAKIVGNAIAYLRKRAGFTQKDLADRLGISDKAVSKWERGIGLPDTSFLTRLSILLDTDTDSLLSGDIIHHSNNWNGLIVLNDNSSISLDTVIFDKPLSHYLLSYFLLVGIKNIKIVCSEKDKTCLMNEYNDGKEYGIKISFANSLHDVTNDKSYMKCQNLMILFGKSFIYGVDQTRFFQKAMINTDRIVLLTLPRGNRKETISFDANKKIVPSDFNEQLKTQYDYSDVPILFCPIEIFANKYKDTKNINIEQIMENNDVYIEVLDRGFVEMTINNWNEVNEASTFVRIVQEKCGMNIYCLEEVAWRRGLINTEELLEFGKKAKNTEYDKYIKALCNIETR